MVTLLRTTSHLPRGNKFVVRLINLASSARQALITVPRRKLLALHYYICGLLFEVFYFDTIKGPHGSAGE